MKQFFKTLFASTLGVLFAIGILFFVGMFSLIGIAASSGNSAIYTPNKNSVLKLNLNGSIAEQAVENPFAQLMGETAQEMSLENIIKAIRKAKNHPDIKGIYIESGFFSGGMASLEAISRELIDFKKSDKFIIAYGDMYTQGGYYISSVADSVFVNPQGSINLIGLASQGMFFTGLTEKLGIEHYIFKVGTYKSAVEPFFLKKFSDANREQLNSFLGSAWKKITGDIKESRNITTADLDRYLNEGVANDEAQKTIDFKLADGLRYRYEVENTIKAMAGQEGDEKLKTADFNKVSTIESKEKVYDDKVAVLYAEGEINVDMPMNPLTGGGKVISEKMAAELRKLKDDDQVKAVVFRVNSPGGSAYISEQIWKEVVELKARKPIVVSMGDYAASGGYYISCAANRIFAEHTTLTGSIGVFGVVRNLAGTMEKIGISTDMVKTNTYADLGDMSRPMREDEKALIQRGVERTYDLFLTRVSEGRGKTKAEIDSIGQGRVWTGEQALERGLVDELGGIDDAVKAAAELAKLDKYTLTVAGGPKDFFTELLEKQMEDMKVRVVKSALGENYTLFNRIEQAKSINGIVARMPYTVEGF